MINPRIKEYNQKGNGIYQIAMNKFTGAKGDNRLRSSEYHPILYTKKGFKVASFMGPGTSLIDRISKKTEPISNSDKESFAHDIRYSLSKDKEDIRRADLKMLQVLKDKPDYLINKMIGSIPIRLKIFGEKIGLPMHKIATFGGIDEEDRELLKSKLEELEQEGFGKRQNRQTDMNLAKRQIMNNEIRRDRLLQRERNEIYNSMSSDLPEEMIDLIIKLLDLAPEVIPPATITQEYDPDSRASSNGEDGSDYEYAYDINEEKKDDESYSDDEYFQDGKGILSNSKKAIKAIYYPINKLAHVFDKIDSLINII